MKHLPLFFAVAAISLIAQSQTASASTPAGVAHLYRSPEQPAVYYTLEDGRRFAFSDQRIYASWYPSFDGVTVVPASTLAQSRLAGVVLYRPGSLIKVATDPHVYLVTNNGELRWIETEAVAQSLFGSAWAARVQDISDAFFFSYRIGTPIRTATDILLSSLLSDTHTLSISDNQGLALAPSSTIPTPPPAPVPQETLRDIVLQSNVTNGIRVNESATINVYANGSAPSSIVILANGVQVQRCEQTARCAYTFSHGDRLSVTSYVIQADATYADGTHKIHSYTIPVIDTLAGSLRQTTSISESQPQGNVDIHTTWSDPVVRPYRISLFANGSQLKDCYGELECNATYGIDARLGDVIDIYSVAEDTSGKSWRTTTSTVTIVTNPKPILSAGFASSVIHTGESASVSALASDENGIAFIEIWQDGTRVARCERPSCSYASTPFTQTGTAQFHVIAQDLLGARQEVDLAPMLIISNIL